MTERTFGLLAANIGFDRSEDLLALLRKPRNAGQAVAGKQRPAKQSIARFQNFEVHADFVNEAVWCGDKGLFVTASDDMTAAVIDSASRQTIKRVIADQQLKAVRFETHDRVLLAGGGGAVWRCDLKFDPPQLSKLFEHSQLRTIDYEAATHLVASGGYDRQIQVWSCDQTFPLSSVGQIGTRAGPVRAIAWNPSGSCLAFSAGPTVHIWNRLHESIADALSLFGHASRVVALSWAQDSATLLSGDQEGVLIAWHVSARKATRRWERYSDLGSIRSIHAHPVLPQRWAIGGTASCIDIMDCSGEKPAVRTLRVAHDSVFVNSLRWRPDGDALLVAYGGRVAVITEGLTS